jgi:hypothetical protein
MRKIPLVFSGIVAVIDAGFALIKTFLNSLTLKGASQ